MKANPDPEEFARKVLWHICGLRAEVRHLHMRLAELFANESGHEVTEVQSKWKKTCEKLQEELYLEVAREVGVPPSKPGK